MPFKQLSAMFILKIQAAVMRQNNWLFNIYPFMWEAM